jgi:hypothetical protein
MAMTHGRGGYVCGCRCDQCKQAESDYQRARRCRQREQVGDPAPSEPGPVEAAIETEIADLTDARPGLAAIARAMARLLDNPKAVSCQPAAAKVLAAMLDKLRTAGAQGRRGRLSLVKSMTEKGGA